MPWTVTSCFSGDNCWCGLILDPEGVERVQYGNITREACQAIVDALNGVHAEHSQVFENYPLPWHTMVIQERFPAIVTSKGLVSDLVEDTISTPGGVDAEHAKLFVDTVNSFYAS